MTEETFTLNAFGRSHPPMTEEEAFTLTAALILLARYNIPPDVQELLVYGNPDRKIPPGALRAILKEVKRQS